ncbi:MAG: T9SS type A sorting domain-containing protein [Crocinitomicaceae bacterium]|nr:T9SS type A sorting domain-containing protein [Crocinitomicaceae bacterium]
MKSAKIIVLVLSLGLYYGNSAVAQQGLNVIGSAGTYTELSNGSISWTLGEVVIVTSSIPTNDVTQGFQQGDIYVLSVKDYADKKLDISVYPNPADDIINVTSSELTKMTIMDMQGKLIDVMDISEITTQVDVSYLSRGTYMLMFEANGTLAKQMKIVIQ